MKHRFFTFELPIACITLHFICVAHSTFLAVDLHVKSANIFVSVYIFSHNCNAR